MRPTNNRPMQTWPGHASPEPTLYSSIHGISRTWEEWICLTCARI